MPEGDKAGFGSRVDRAAEAAALAFREYSQRSSAHAQLLRAIATGIQALGEPLIECVMRETSLPRPRVENERGRTCMQLRLFADVAEAGQWRDERVDAADPQRQPPKPQVRSLLRPLGPVVVFAASNFPLAFSVAGGDTAAALAVGCTVIVKAHPAHPQTAALIAGVIDRAASACDLPTGVFSIVFDEGDHSVGIELLRHPKIKAAAFTGSQRAGLALLRVAQERAEPIPFFAEMGSVNPVFLSPRCIAKRGDEVAVGLHGSMVLGVGQFCTQPGLIFLIDDAHGRHFLQKLSTLVAGTPHGTMLTVAMSEGYRHALEQRAAIAGVNAIANVRCEQSSKTGAALLTVDAATFLATPVLHEEVFGPASLVVMCASEKDYLACAAHLPGQLTATLWIEADELHEHTELLWLLEQKAGRILFNGFPTGVEVGAAMMHGGPFPATNDSRFTSVGTRALQRFVRPVAYQNELQGRRDD